MSRNPKCARRTVLPCALYESIESVTEWPERMRPRAQSTRVDPTPSDRHNGARSHPAQSDWLTADKEQSTKTLTASPNGSILARSAGRGFRSGRSAPTDPQRQDSPARPTARPGREAPSAARASRAPFLAAAPWTIRPPSSVVDHSRWPGLRRTAVTQPESGWLPAIDRLIEASDPRIHRSPNFVLFGASMPAGD